MLTLRQKCDVRAKQSLARGDDLPAILLENVSRYFGDVPAVLAVDLPVEQGEFVTLLGPSGCGKTTTLRMVAGLEENTTGRISIAERVVSDADKGLMLPADKRQLGMVFQSYAIWPHMTVFDNVAYPLRIRRRPAPEITARVMAALDIVEMGPYAERPAPALSGGQQQRVAIARALVFEPSVLLLDEPLSNLDAKLRTQMGDEFRALQRRLGFACLYVTHDQSEAMALSDRVVVMDRGRVLQIDAPERIYRQPSSRTVAAFFGQPNILEARVVSCTAAAAGMFDLVVEGQGWRGRATSGKAFAAGSPALIVIRPESVQVGVAANGSGRIGWHGRVVNSVFRGATRTQVVETTSGQLISIETPALAAAAVGDEVDLAVVPDGAWAVDADAAT